MFAEKSRAPLRLLVVAAGLIQRPKNHLTFHLVETCNDGARLKRDLLLPSGKSSGWISFPDLMIAARITALRSPLTLPGHGKLRSSSSAAGAILTLLRSEEHTSELQSRG